MSHIYTLHDRYFYYLTNSKYNETNAIEETRSPMDFLILFLYVVIFVASLFGNAGIIHIIRTDNSMKTTTNYLILNEACADLAVTVTTIIEINLLHPISNNRLWFGEILGGSHAGIFSLVPGCGCC